MASPTRDAKPMPVFSLRTKMSNNNWRTFAAECEYPAPCGLGG